MNDEEKERKEPLILKPEETNDAERLFEEAAAAVRKESNERYMAAKTPEERVQLLIDEQNEMIDLALAAGMKVEYFDGTKKNEKKEKSE